MSQTHSTQKSQYVQYGDRSKYYQIVYLRFAKRVNFKHTPQNKNRKTKLYEVIDIVSDLLVVIISQCMHGVSNQHMYMLCVYKFIC